MERPSETKNAPSTKRKLSSSEAADQSKALGCDPFRSTMMKKVSDISAHGIDEDGFIEGQIVMKWPVVNHAIRVYLEIQENGHSRRLEVVFARRCVDYFQSADITLYIRDRLQLGLRGATIMAPLSSQKDGMVPMILKYDSGVVMKFLSSSRQGQSGFIVNTWEASRKKSKISNGNGPLGDDWFSTPLTPPVPIEAPKPPPGSLHQPPDPKEACTRPSIDNGTTSPRFPPSDPSGPGSGQQNVAPKPSLTSGSLVPKGTISLSTKPHTPAPSPIHAPQRSLYRTAPVVASSLLKAPGNLPLQSTSQSSGSSRAPSVLPDTGDNAKLTKKAQKKARRVAKKALRDQDVDGSKPEESNGPSTGERPAQTVQTLKPAEQPSPSPSLLIKGQVNPKSHQKAPSRELDHPEFPSGGGSQASKHHHDDKTHLPPSSNAPSENTPSLSKNVETKGNGDNAAAPAPLSPAKDSDPALSLEAGCCVPNATPYVPLNTLTASGKYNVIGVVVKDEPLRSTSRGEFWRRLTLVDPSNLEADDLSKGFSIMVFTKRQEDNVPPAKIGDVFLFRGVMVAAFQDTWNGSGPSFKTWIWILFCSETGDTKQSPGSSMSFTLSEEELEYRTKLIDWWKAVQERHGRELQESGVTIHRLGEGDGPSYGNKAARVHRLIKDASPSAPPDGYFDCTIEVLHVHKNDNGVYSLYATDYTRNDAITPVDASWCRPGLADMILKIEMWDDAAEVGAKMAPGDFYFIGNARIRVSAGGYLEGKAAEPKLRKLNEDELEDEPHLVELIRRKNVWEQDHQGSEVGDPFPHLLFKDVTPDKFFRCTVQVVHMSDKDDKVYLYVTDYTSRRDLAPTHLESARINVPDNSIVRVMMSDDQAAAAKNLRPLDYVSLRNLKLKANGILGYLSGKLGGDQRLIYKLRGQGTGSEELLALIKRKEEWEAKCENGQEEEVEGKPQQVTKQVNTKEDSGVKGQPPKANQTRPGTINRALQIDVCPARFRIQARVVDYYPLKIEDFAFLRCNQCKEEIPEERRMCTKCDDSMDETFVRPLWRFFLEIEDDEGSRLQIVVNRPSCTLLDGLEPSDLHEDEDTLEELKEKLAPILGNVVDNHERIMAQQEPVEAVTPMLKLIVASCPLGSDGKRAYVLLQHELQT